MATKEYDRWKADEARRYLRSVQGAQTRIHTLAATIADLYAEVEGVRALDYSEAGVAGGAPGDGLAGLLADKDERMRECQRQAHELECRVRRAQYALGKMDRQDYAALLECHYVRGLTWEEAARAMHCSRAHVFRVRDDAHAAFYDCMPSADVTDIPDARWSETQGLSPEVETK